MEMKPKRSLNTACAIGTGIIWLGLTAPANAAVIINEIDYDQPGSDTAEFIELYNNGINPVPLDGYTINLVNGSNGSSYNSFDLTGLSITANGYLVICDLAFTVVNCDFGADASGWMQNGGSDGDAVALLLNGDLQDSVTYEGIGSHLDAYAEGGSFTTGDSNSIDMSIARLPDGIDTNINGNDFGSACITPGSANISGSGNCSASINPVPVPAAVWLFASGLIGLIGISRRNTLRK